MCSMTSSRLKIGLTQGDTPTHAYFQKWSSTSIKLSKGRQKEKANIGIVRLHG